MRSFLLPALLILGCGGSPDLGPVTATAGGAAPPRLVVLIVIDQLPSYWLTEHLGDLAPDGALRRLARRGLYVERSRFPYAVTFTAPGHATIATGALPSEHGVVANRPFDPARGRRVTVVDDGRHAVLGRDDAFASPAILMVDGIADRLERATGGASKIVSVSLKDRAAVLLGGRTPDAAVWFDGELHRFTTSTYYATTRPAWLDAFEAEHPIDAMLAPWRFEPDAGLRERLGPDDAAGEGDLAGFGRTFPHDPRSSEEAWLAAKTTPAASRLLLELARAAIAAHGLGVDPVPDLLALSISTTDYAGHLFGPESWEYFHTLHEADAMLGRLLVDLEASVGPIGVVITSDHGVARLPERGPLGGGGRHALADVSTELEAALVAELGAGPWVASIAPPYVHLVERPERARARAAAVGYLASRPWIAAAVAVADGRIVAGGGPVLPAATRALVAASLAPGRGGEIFFIPADGAVIVEDDPLDAGTNHGTHYAYDREVPLLAEGAGIAPHRRAVGDQREVARLVGELLGLADLGPIR